MQFDSELTLNNTVYQARQSEAVKQQQAEVRGENMVSEAELKQKVDSISRYKKKRTDKWKQNKPTDNQMITHSCG